MDSNSSSNFFRKTDQLDYQINSDKQSPCEEKNQLQFGRYIIESELGRGGMGVVYKAYDTKLKTTIALKIIMRQEKEYIERFFLETSAIAKLNHPHIVRFYEYGETPNPHFTMEYIEGNTLHDLIKENNVAPLDLVDLMISLSDALYYAHKNNIVHRDIKPSNIMITKDGIPKIMDFGLAKATDAVQQLSKSGQMMGTVAYMAPEQVEGKAVKESDIYSFGASMYEALTYRTVFQGQIEINIIVQIMNEDPVPPRQLNPDISPYLEAICLKCLNKNIKKRYRDFKQLSRELKNFKNHKPIIAKKYTSWNVLQNFMRKHKIICLSILLIFITLSVALIITTRALTYAQRQKNVANQALEQTRNQKLVADNALKQTKELNKNLKKEENQSNKLAITVATALKHATIRDQSLLRDQKYLAFFKEILKQAETSKSKDEFQWIRGLVLGHIANKEDQQKGIEHYNKIIASNAKDASGYNIRGSLYQKQNKYQQAEQDFNKAIALNPKYIEAYINRAHLYEKQNKYQKAKKNYDQAIALNPKYANSYMNRGSFYYRYKKYQKAENDYNKTIVLAPQLPDVYFNRGNLYYLQGKHKDALTDYNKAVALNPLFVDVYVNRGVLCFDLKRYKQAEKNYSKAITLNPKLADAYFNRGNLYSSQRKYKKAENDYDKAIALSPNYAQIYGNRGVVYYNQQRYEKAIQNWEKAISLGMPEHLLLPWINKTKMLIKK